MKLNILLFTLIFSSFLLAQEKVQFIKHGELTMKNNEKIEFTNLKYEEDKVVFTNIKTQQIEHLYLSSILSVDEGEIELIDESEVEKTLDSSNLPDGIYLTFESLVQKNPSAGNYTLELANAKKNFYVLLNEKGKKVIKAFAYVQNGELYVRPGGMKRYQSNKKSLTFTRNQKFFLKMDFQEGEFVAQTNFYNSTLFWVGILATGTVGGLIIYAASINEKDIVINLNTQKLYLR